MRILGIERPLVLSPMVDVTDAAFRSLAREWGADITCSEMVAAAGINHGNQKSWRLVRPWPGESPYGVQLMGSTPDDVAAAAARIADQLGPDFIDINLGCPSPNILRSCAGGFLLRDPPLVGQVVAATVAAVDLPVSVKLRTGPDGEHPTYLDVGAEAQAAGAAWVTLHGRSVAQAYSGDADWSTIAALADHLDIPVVGNGDLRGAEDVARMGEETDCAGFFIARAAMHDPTVFGRMRQALDGEEPEPAPGLDARLGALRTYLERAAVLGDVPLAVLKRQATRFIHGVPGAKALRNALHAAPDAAGVLSSLEVAHADRQDRAPQEQRREHEA